MQYTGCGEREGRELGGVEGASAVDSWPSFLGGIRQKTPSYALSGEGLVICPASTARGEIEAIRVAREETKNKSVSRRRWSMR